MSSPVCHRADISPHHHRQTTSFSQVSGRYLHHQHPVSVTVSETDVTQRDKIGHQQFRRLRVTEQVFRPHHHRQTTSFSQVRWRFLHHQHPESTTFSERDVNQRRDETPTSSSRTCHTAGISPPSSLPAAMFSQVRGSFVHPLSHPVTQHTVLCLISMW